MISLICSETSSSVSSVAFCPYDEPFMLLGSEDGSIRLHSTNNDRCDKTDIIMKVIPPLPGL